MRPVPKPRHLLAVMIFAAVSSATGYLAILDNRLSVTQIQIATAAIKRHQPDLYASDPVFGESNLWLSHTPAFQSLLEMSLVPTNYQDIMLPFEAMAGILVMIYLCGMYALLFRQCRSWSVSAFVAVLSCTITHTLGEAYWGVGSLASVTPQTLLGVLVPLIVLAFLRHRRQWQIMLVFGVIGLTGNMHMPTAMNLAIVLLIVYLGVHRFAPSCWPRAMGCGLAVLVGSLPRVLYYLAIRSRLTPLGFEASAESLNQALALGKLTVLYPAMLKDMLNWLLLSGVLVVTAIAVLSRVERFRVRDLGTWVWFIAAGLFVSLGLHRLSQLAGELQGQPPPIIEFYSASSFVMLPLYVLFAQALTNLFRLVRSHRTAVQWACAALMVAWMVPSDNLRVGRYAVLDTATMFMAEANKPSRVQRHHDRNNRDAELRNIAAWARKNTDKFAIFLSGSVEFRMLSHRSVVGSRDDAHYYYYLAPGRLDGWADRVLRRRRLLHPRSGTIDGDAVTQFATELAADEQFSSVKEWYAIVRTKFTPGANGGLTPVQPSGWGRHYTVYRLH